MGTVTQLLGPDVFSRLDKTQLELLQATVEAEMIRNDVIRKELGKVLNKVVPHMLEGKRR